MIVIVLIFISLLIEMEDCSKKYFDEQIYFY